VHPAGSPTPPGLQTVSSGDVGAAGLDDMPCRPSRSGRHPVVALASSDRKGDGRRVGTHRCRSLHSPTPDTIPPIAPPNLRQSTDIGSPVDRPNRAPDEPRRGHVTGTVRRPDQHGHPPDGDETRPEGTEPHESQSRPAHPPAIPDSALPTPTCPGRADLRAAILHHTDLRDAVLTGADVRSTDLRGADLTSAIITGIWVDAGTRLPVGLATASTIRPSSHRASNR
jgi:hypothetical protein